MNVTIANRVKLGVTLVCTAILMFVLYVSRDHITHTAHTIGLGGYQAETLFILIDIVAIVGKVLTMKYFAKSTRKIGLRLLVTAGTLSLACNVFAGSNLGERLYGAFIVVLFVGLEQVVTRIKPAPAVTAAKTREAKATTTEATVTKKTTAKKCAAGCTCGKHSPVRTPKAPAAAPVSPGHGPVSNAPSEAELDDMIAA